MKHLALFLLCLASCDGSDSSSIETQDVNLGPIAFEVPAEWQRTNTERSGALSAVWTPAAVNKRKESITVIRSPMRRSREQLVKGDLEKLLAGAQGSLSGAKVSKVTPISTRRGLSGARIDVSFQPGANSKRYHRVHVVLMDVETSRLVHVLYTAANPDDDLTAFHTVLETLRSEEG